MVSLWPRSSVTQWSLLLALLSLSSLNSLSLSSLSLSLFWGDSNSHKQNQTTVPTNSLSLLLVLSLSICHSLSLYFSFFLSEVILKATEQRLPVHKHWVPAQALLLSLCVTKDCQESSVTVCYKSQNKSQSKESLINKTDLMTAREVSNHLQCNKNFQSCWNFCPKLESLSITPLFQSFDSVLPELEIFIGIWRYSRSYARSRQINQGIIYRQEAKS